MRATAEMKAGTETMTRQKRWKVVRYRMGKCVNCGQNRKPSPYKRLCSGCGEARKKKRRKARGNREWKPGSPGRPPLKSQIETTPKRSLLEGQI